MTKKFKNIFIIKSKDFNNYTKLQPLKTIHLFIELSIYIDMYILIKDSIIDNSKNTIHWHMCNVTQWIIVQGHMCNVA